jgi:hypothetical protein
MYSYVVYAVAFCAFVTGCATPSEVKQASKLQLELIDSLDASAVGLQTGLNQHFAASRALMLEEGRILLAQQAIDQVIADKGNNVITADELFTTFKADIEPYITDAFTAPDLEAVISRRLQKRAELKDRLREPSLTDAEKSRLTAQIDFLSLDINDLKLRQARLAQKPESVQALEQLIQADIAKVDATEDTVSKRIKLLREQIALMKLLAESVDEWLVIDITISQEQADALTALTDDIFSELNARLDQIEGEEQDP